MHDDNAPAPGERRLMLDVLEPAERTTAMHLALFIAASGMDRASIARTLAAWVNAATQELRIEHPAADPMHVRGLVLAVAKGVTEALPRASFRYSPRPPSANAN